MDKQIKALLAGINALKSGQEELKNTLEEKINKMEEKIENVKEHFKEIPVPASPVSVKLYAYDGNTNWEVYKIQFCMISEANGWTEG
ncbi:hypothetical protein TNCV_154221 [Trichonephila clavipes]|nr:hypothetical protein TNCV_154221 [Trichonephila clavipes]